MIQFDSEDKPNTLDHLTKRELEVLKCIAGGMKNKEIAESLYISVRTVEFHRGNINRKLQTNRVSELTQLATVLELEERTNKESRKTSDYIRMEQSLQIERRRLNAALEAIDDGLIVTDRKGRIVTLNLTAEILTGYIKASAIGKPAMKVVSLIDAQSRTILDNPIDRTLRTGIKTQPIHNPILIDKTQKETIIKVSAYPIQRKQNDIIGVILVLKIPDRFSNIKEAFLKEKEFESLGILSGKIAHDFNNILTSILGNINIAKISLSQDSPTYENLDIAEQSVFRAKKLSNRLLTFASGGAPVKEPWEIRKTIDNSVDYITMSSNVKFKYLIDSNLWTVDADPKQMSNVMNCLITNAIQAMTEGGIITITGENITINSSKTFQLPKGEYIKLIVKDEGTGIDSKNLPKIFNPFFTTNKSNIGLGLSIVYSIIKKHNGTITVKSEPGKGSEFCIILPKDQKEKKIESAGITSYSYNNSKRILFMDDEEIIRQVARGMFEILGYETVMARNGEEAIQLYKESLKQKKYFAAVFLDLTICGGLGGKETIKKLIAIDPGIIAVVSSGYSNDAVLNQYYDFGFQYYLPKPYQIKDIREIIKKLSSTKRTISNDKI